jgi:hypothetical protein
MGALLAAAPLFSQAAAHELLRFQLTESRQQVAELLGLPALVAPFGDFESWHYQLGIDDHHEYSHNLVFRQDTGELVSVSRNYEEKPQVVDELFPEPESFLEHYPSADRPAMTLRVRRLEGGRVLIALGAAAPGQPATQLLLIRESELRLFLPWLAESLASRR